MRYLKSAAMAIVAACVFGSGFLICPQAEAQVQAPEGRRRSVNCFVRFNGVEVDAQGCPRLVIEGEMQRIDVYVTLRYWVEHPTLIELGRTYIVSVGLQQPYREDVLEALYKGFEIKGVVTMIEVVQRGRAGKYVKVRVENG